MSLKNSASKLETGNQTIDSITKVGGGAALGGILSMILGRSGGASLAKLGSLAVLGNLAYQLTKTIKIPTKQPTKHLRKCV